MDKLREKAAPQRQVWRARQHIRAVTLPAQFDFFRTQSCGFKRSAGIAARFVGLLG